MKTLIDNCCRIIKIIVAAFPGWRITQYTQGRFIIHFITDIAPSVVSTSNHQWQWPTPFLRSSLASVLQDKGAVSTKWSQSIKHHKKDMQTQVSLLIRRHSAPETGFSTLSKRCDKLFLILTWLKNDCIKVPIKLDQAFTLAITFDLIGIDGNYFTKCCFEIALDKSCRKRFAFAQQQHTAEAILTPVYEFQIVAQTCF